MKKIFFSRRISIPGGCVTTGLTVSFCKALLTKRASTVSSTLPTLGQSVLGRFSYAMVNPDFLGYSFEGGREVEEYIFTTVIGWLGA